VLFDLGLNEKLVEPENPKGDPRSYIGNPNNGAEWPTGARLLGNMAGSGGMLPVRSHMAFARSRIAC
jgi:hypothetical protein